MVREGFKKNKKLETSIRFCLPRIVWLSVSLLTFMVTVKYSSNQMNNIIFSLKLTLILILLLAKYQVYRPFTGNTDLLQTQKCKKVCITDLGL